MKSKRSALRFSCTDQPVSYKTAYDAGEAQLLNISAVGCAFLQPSCPVSVGEKILVTLHLPAAEVPFQAQGVVVRIENNGCTAVQFTLVEPEDQSLVRNHFSKLLRKK
jgi:hypothetical protein